jgi:hypothetical protein
MHTKTVRIPDRLLQALALVESREHIEESTAIRKLIRTGLETYIARLYERGEITLRDAASKLNLDLIETTELLLDHGIKGNLRANDVLASIQHFVET